MFCNSEKATTTTTTTATTSKPVKEMTEEEKKEAQMKADLAHTTELFGTFFNEKKSLL